MSSNVDNLLLINVRERSFIFIFKVKRDMLSCFVFHNLFAQKADKRKRTGINILDEDVSPLVGRGESSRSLCSSSTLCHTYYKNKEEQKMQIS